MKNKIHEGKILAHFLKENGYTITGISQKLHISRTTFYSRLKLKKLPQTFVTAITNATSQELLPLILQGKVVHPKQKQNKKELIYNYIKILEKHVELLETSTNILFKVIKEHKQQGVSQTLEQVNPRPSKKVSVI